MLALPPEESIEANAPAMVVRGEIVPIADYGMNNDPAEVERVGAKAEGYFDPMQNGRWREWVRQYAGMFKIAWIERAVEDQNAKPEKPFSFAPLLNMLRRWDRAGGPPPIPEPSSRKPFEKPASSGPGSKPYVYVPDPKKPKPRPM